MFALRNMSLTVEMTDDIMALHISFSMMVLYNKPCTIMYAVPKID
jgi:hypothetical protein